MSSQSSQLLVFLWGVALIFSGIGTYYEPARLLHSWSVFITVIAGFGVVISPLSVRMVQLSVWIYLAAFVVQMPANPNHRWVLFLIALSFFRRLNSPIGVEELAKRAQGSLRWITVIVYLFAVLAKLNTAYLDPAKSCAANFFDQTFFLYVIGSCSLQHLSEVMAGISVIAELLLPLMLICSRSRILAVILGIVFHICLALNLTRYFANFSAAMFVLLVSWLPADCCARIHGATVRNLIPSIRIWVLALGLVVAFSLTGLVSVTEYIIARHVLFLGFAFTLLILVLRNAKIAICNDRIGQPSLLILSLALINACTPYLGIKTRSALTMYSNLRIEPGYSNHLFIPSCPDPFGLLSDRVEIVTTTHPGLQQRLKQSSSRELLYIGLCAFMACQDDLCTPTNYLEKISYSRGGVLVTHKLDQPLPNDCPPWIARKLLLFGPVGTDSERICLW